MARIREFLFQFKVYRWIAGHSQFYRFIRHSVYFHIRKPLAVWIKRISSVFKPTSNNGNTTTERQEDQNKSDVLHRKELTIALLKEMKRECTSNGASFLIFDIPIKLSPAEFESRFLVSEADTIEYFDVFNPIELFKQQKGKKIYWEIRNGHFTPLGCRIIGEGLAKLILSKGLLKTSSDQLLINYSPQNFERQGSAIALSESNNGRLEQSLQHGSSYAFEKTTGGIIAYFDYE